MGEKVDVTRVLGRHAGSDRRVTCQLLSLVLFLTSGLTAHCRKLQDTKEGASPWERHRHPGLKGLAW